MVERNLAKVEVESSRLFSRSRFYGYGSTPHLVPAARFEFHSYNAALNDGGVAKRLCSGLQSRVDRFDSGPRLQIFQNMIKDLAYLR